MAKKIAGVYVKMDADSAGFRKDLLQNVKAIRGYGAKLNREANRIKYAFNSIRRAAQVVASAFIFTAGIKQIGALAVGVERAEERITLMTARLKQFGRSGNVFARTYDLAQKLGVSMDSAADGMTRLFIASKSFGASQREIETMYENIVLLGRAGGSSAEEMKGAMRQLTQGMASGRVAGEELRSILENLPLVAYEIADELNVGIGALRKLGAEGKITGEVVTKALQEIPKAVKELPEVFSQHVSRLKTEWDLFLAVLGKQVKIDVVLNVVTDYLAEQREAMGDFSTVPQERLESLLDQWTDTVTKLESEFRSRFSEGTVENMMAAGLIPDDLERALEMLGKVEKELTARSAGSLEALKAYLSSQEAALIKAVELSKLIKEIQIIDIGDRLLAKSKRLNDHFKKLGETIKNKIGGPAKEFADKMHDARVALGRGFIDEEEFAKYKAILLDTFVGPADQFEESMNKMSEYAKRAAQNMQDAFADFLFDPFADGVKGMLEGFLTAIRRMIAEQAAASFFETSGISGFIKNVFGRASGGPVAANTPYIVGERGPELFMSNTSGSIIPNGAMGGVVVNQSYHIEAGADWGTLQKVLPPLFDRNREATVAEIRTRINEGNL